MLNTLDTTHATIETVRSIELHPGDLLADGSRVIAVDYVPHGVWLAIVLTLLWPGPDGPEVIVDGQPDDRPGAYTSMPAVDRYTVVRRAARTQVYDDWSLPNEDRLCGACGMFHEPDGTHNCWVRPHLQTVRPSNA